MQKFVATMILIALLAAFGCSKQPASSTDQSANPNAPASSTDQSANPNAPAAAQTQGQPASASAPSQAEQTPAPPPAPAPEAPKPIVVPAGSSVTVRTAQALSSDKSQTGAVFMATVNSPVSVGGEVAIPAGSPVEGVVVEAQEKGKVKGEGVLQLRLTQVTIKGQTYPIQTSVWSQSEKGKGKRTAKTTGGGAAAGALIGAIAGGGKGAAIGAGIGAGAGFIGGAATGNKQIELPAETALTFSLKAELTIKP